MIRKPTPKIFKTMLEEVRDNPDYSLERIAKAHGVDPAVLQDWYDNGVDPAVVKNINDFEGGGAPIKVQLQLKHTVVRSSMKIPEDPDGSYWSEKPVRTIKYELSDAWDAARKDAIESIVLKGKSARAARNNAAALLSITGRMLSLSKPLLAELEKKMNDPEFLEKQSVDRILGIYGKMARMSKDVMEAARMADDIEEALLGRPEGLADADIIDADDEASAVAIIEAAAEAASEVRALGTAARAVGYTGADEEDS
jgi:hypothetical protein